MNIQKVLIIAEAGVNHNGDINIAKKLIDAAKDAGADYVKFQTFKADKLVSKEALKADYQIKNTSDKNESQYEMLAKLELSIDDHYELISYCRDQSINFFSTAFDLESLDFLNTLGFSIFKVPSGEITNLPYLKKMASFGKPIILSTGMSTLGEVEDALEVFLNEGLKMSDIIVLHCNTEYPTPMEDVNLNAMNTIAKEFDVAVGYSDHTDGIDVAIAAVAKGAVCIEKHFTLDRNMDGPDHMASLEPDELREMIKSIRNIEKALGDGIKRPSSSETKNIRIARKSIHATKDLNENHIITIDDLIMMRPGNGISPMEMNDIIGRKLVYKVNKNEMLNSAHFI